VTNDRTAAAIRRHLLETADERPASGQLEASLRLTSTTRQRARWIIAVRELAYPSAALPRTALRFGLLAALLVIAAAGIATLGGGSGGGTPFEGTWTSIDPGDGSAQTLVVGPGANPMVHFEDAFSIMCDQTGDATTLFVAEGPGEISTYRLTAHFPESGCVTWRVSPFDATFDFNPEADTLLDDTGITWRRQP
jgi:hypothetical protein